MESKTIIESELIVLGTIIADNNYLLKAIDLIKPNDFYKTSHKVIFKKMLELYKSNTEFDSTVLANNLMQEIKKGVTTVTELGEISTRGEPSTFKAHLKLIKEDSNNRKLNNVLKQLVNSDLDSNSKIEKLQNAILDITSSSEEDTHITINQAVSNTLKKIEQVANSKNGITGISTGIIELDNSLNGLERGTMTVLGARPSMGKTALSLEILRGLEVNVLYIQLDMTIEGMTQRLISSISNIENRYVGRGKLNDDEWRKVIKAVGFLEKKNNIFFYTPKNPTINNILLKAKEIKSKYGLDVIIIDHIGKIKPITKGNRYEQMTYISGELKRMALEMDIALIALCQLSRGTESRQDKRPMLSDLRDTGAIEEDADNIGLLYRDGYYKAREEKENGTTEEGKSDILELHLLKVRNGRIGVIGFEYNLETQRLTQILNN